MSLNIIQLIENKNQIIHLSDKYENKLINKIKDNFKESEQQMFITNFYAFLMYDTEKDFVIDFDNVWKWMGFSRKDPAKRLLEKNFTKNIDYKNNIPPIGGILENEKGDVVRPSETILLTVDTFKKFCLKTGTKKADEIHNYYIKLEKLLHETINEETQELKKQLLIKDEKNTKLEEENAKIQEEKVKVEDENELLLRKYVKKPKEIHKDKNVVYIMATKESELKKEYAIGKSKDLNQRQNDYNHNKLHDFKVIYYKSFSSPRIMDYVESIVLTVLSEYKCKATRDAFRLPEGCDMSTFTDIFDICSKLFENVEETNVIFPKATAIIDKDKERERHKKYNEEHKEEIKERDRLYYENNKEEISERQKHYYDKNTDVISEKHKEYYDENKDEIKGQALEYYYENKEDILEKRKEFYENNKEIILDERQKYYEENYKTKIATQRQKPEQCECGLTVTHYNMKKHKKSKRHELLMSKKESGEIEEENNESEYDEEENIKT